VIRSVYCPSEEFLEEAQSLAEKYSLSITVGRSESMESIDFDETGVCIVHIPTIHVFHISSSTLPVGLMQAFSYMCDYVDFKKDGNTPILKVRHGHNFSEEIEIQPSYMESHIAKYSHRFSSVGVHDVSIVVAGEEYVKNYTFEVTE